MNFSDILLVSDYDNTLTGERHLVPQENLDAVRAFTAEGGAFTIASGRGKREWYESFCHVPFNAPLVLSNGAFIYDSSADKVLYRGVLTQEQVKSVKTIFRSLPEGTGGVIEVDEMSYIPEEVYEAGGFKGFPGQTVLHPPLDEIPDGWNKVSFMCRLPDFQKLAEKGEVFDFGMLDVSGVDEAEKMARKLGLSGIRSLPMMFEVPPEGTDKGTSARRLQKLLGRKVLAAIGDAPNDLAMLEKADICFVPAESILDKEGLLPEGAVLTVRCEEAAIADAVRLLREM